MKSEELNDLYQRSCDLILPYIRLEGAKREDVNTPKAKEAIAKGSEGLRKVLTYNTTNWPARWMLGKVHQTLGEHEEAYESFRLAHKVNVKEQSILRELALECLHTKRYDDAAYYCQAAIEFDVDDYTLWPNMAVARMFQGKLAESEDWAKRALAKLPDDEPAKNLLRILKEISDGTRSIPTDYASLEAGDEA